MFLYRIKITKGKEVAAAVPATTEGKLRVKMARMKENMRKQNEKIINLEVKIDELKEIKMENSQLCFVAGLDY